MPILSTRTGAGGPAPGASDGKEGRVKLDLLIRNARTRFSKGKTLDIGIAGGRIAKIGQRIGGEAKRKIDAGGKLVAESFVNGHLHLDKVYTLSMVGMDALSAHDRLLLETAKMIREDFLHQNAYDPVDTYTSLAKQFRLLQAILAYYHYAKRALEAGTDLNALISLPVREEISRAKFIPENELQRFDEIKKHAAAQAAAAAAK